MKYSIIKPFASNFLNDHYLHNTLDNLLNVKNNYQEKDNYLTVPRANIIEDENGYSIELAAPGFSRDEFELNLDNNTLTVSVNTEDTPEYNKSVTMREYKFQSFSRSWYMPDNTNTDGIAARYEAGILYIDIPIDNQSKGKKTITVQ